MYLKLMAENVCRFVDEGNIRKIEKLRRTFLVEPELDEYGELKKYTSQEVINYIGGKSNVKDLNSIFGLNTKKSGISIKNTNTKKETLKTTKNRKK